MTYLCLDAQTLDGLDREVYPILLLEANVMYTLSSAAGLQMINDHFIGFYTYSSFGW